MNVKDFMTANVQCVTLDMTVKQAITVLTTNKISGAPVVDNSQKVISVISEGSLLKLAAAKFLDKSIASCLSHLPKTESIISLSSSSTFIEAYRLFLTNPVHRIIIADSNGRLQGIVSRSNVLRILVNNSVPKEKDEGTPPEAEENQVAKAKKTSA